MFIADDPALATDLFFASSANDADAWLQIHGARYRTPLYFFITGHVPEPYHAALIRPYALQRKIHFLFSKDDTGALCDLKLAAYIRDKPISIRYAQYRFLIIFENSHYELERLSLNALEKASGYNFHIRTHKPKNFSTYYEQFRNGNHT